MSIQLKEIAQSLNREERMLSIYERCFPSIARFVNQHGGTLEDAKDIFQDTLVAYYEGVVSQRIAIETSEEAYLTGIAKNLWFKRFRQEKTMIPIDDINDQEESITSTISLTRLMNYLETAGKRCLDLLRSFYYDNTTLDEITQHFKFSSPHSAAVQKYKCLEKVRDKVKEKMMSHEDFLE